MPDTKQPATQPTPASGSRQDPHSDDPQILRSAPLQHKASGAQLTLDVKLPDNFPEGEREVLRIQLQGLAQQLAAAIPQLRLYPESGKAP